MEKEYTISDQLILARDCQQLEQEKSRLEDNLERKKRELLSAIDLIKKETEKLKGIQDLEIKTQDKIREDQLSWNTEKRLAQEEIDSKQIEITKILNRESYIKLQEQKLIQVENGLIKRENEVNEKEKNFVEREERVINAEKQLKKDVEEAKSLTEKEREKAKSFKEKILTEINNW